MKHKRVLIIHLMSVVLLFAIGFASLRFPSPIWASILFTAALGLPLIAILKSIVCQGPDRIPWIGIALFGLSFLSVGFSMPSSVLNVSSSMPPPDTVFAQMLTASSRFANPDIYGHINNSYPKWPGSGSAPINALATCYFSCCNSLGSLFSGLVGGVLGQWFATSTQRERGPVSNERRCVALVYELNGIREGFTVSAKSCDRFNQKTDRIAFLAPTPFHRHQHPFQKLAPRLAYPPR